MNENISINYVLCRVCCCLFCVVTKNSFNDDAEQETYLTAYVWRNWVSAKSDVESLSIVEWEERRMEKGKKVEIKKNTMECTDFAGVTTLTWLILTQLIDRKHRRRKNIITQHTLNGIWLFFSLFCSRVCVCVILIPIFCRHNGSEPSQKNGRIIKSGRLNNILECDYSYAGDIVLTQIFSLFFWCWYLLLLLLFLCWLSTNYDVYVCLCCSDMFTSRNKIYQSNACATYSIEQINSVQWCLCTGRDDRRSEQTERNWIEWNMLRTEIGPTIKINFWHNFQRSY